MKFKNQISVLLAIFLLVSNIGFALDVHYCAGKVASVKPVFWKNSSSSISTEDECCPPKITKKDIENDSCCKDKIVHLQKKSGKVTLHSITFQPDFVFLIEDWKSIPFTIITKFEYCRTTSYFCDANAPPLFKLYQQYIFYA
jgi:hypothetical protein